MKKNHPSGKSRIIYGASVAAYCMVAVYITVKYLLEQKWIMAALGPVSLLFLLIPKLAEMLFRFKLGNPVKSMVLVFGIIAFQLGVLLRYYDSIALYDIIMHLLSGVVFTLVGFMLYGKFNRLPHKRSENGLLQTVFALSFSMLIAVLWEAAEFAVFLLIGHDAQHHYDTGVFDTMEDLISCLAGSIIVATDYLLSVKWKKRLPLTRLLLSFDRANPPSGGDLF